MLTSPSAGDEGAGRRGLNPHAESFFPRSVLNPNPSPTFPPHRYFPPFHFITPPVPYHLPYSPSTPAPVRLPEPFPAANCRGGGSHHRPRGRGFGAAAGHRRGATTWRPQGALVATRRRGDSFDEGGSRSGPAGDDESGSSVIGMSVGESGYERVVEPRCRRDVIARRQKPILPLSPDGAETTIMIRNIPNKYTRDLLINFLDSHCAAENRKLELAGSDEQRSAYDFVYLPLDFRRKANLGYAFVNFTDPRSAWRFFVAANSQRWELFYSSKVRDIASARLQGKEELVRHFKRTIFACESEDFLPVCFSPPRDGSGNQVMQRTVGGLTPTKYQ